MAAPAIPSNLYVQTANGQVYLSWDISAGATTYPILRSLDNVTFVQIAAPAINNYLDTTVTVGTQYFYAVEANNGTASSPTASQGIVPALDSTMSLGQIRLSAQQRADRVNSNFVTLPEWNSYINQALFELYDLLVTVYDDYFLAVPYQFITNGSQTIYPMPTGSSSFLDINSVVAKPFYKLRGVDLGLDQSGNALVTVKKFDFIARNRYVYPNITSGYLGVFNLRYRLMGNDLHFIPTPASGQVIRVWYVPKMSQLLKDTDIADGVSGWLEYVIVRAAKYALDKEESDSGMLTQELMFLKQRIEESAINRDIGEPDTISATRRWGDNGSGWGTPGGDGSYGGY